MKKYNLLKALGITLLIVMLISWVIPAGYYQEGVYNPLNMVLPIGIYDLFRLPVISIVTFIQYGVLFLTIGGFYGVLNKTEVYGKLVNEVSSKNKSVFLTISIILFALLASVAGSINLLFLLVPFFIAVLIKMGYSKITSFAATIGAMLVGQVGTTFGFSTWGYFKYIFGISMFDLILVRAILFVMITILYVIIVRKKAVKEISAKNKQLEKIDIPLHEEGKTNKSYAPLVIVSVIAFVFLLVSSYNWFNAYDIDLFTTLYEAITTFEFADMPIFGNILGGISEIGFFGNYDISIVLIIVSVIMGWIYSLKLSDIVDGFVNGCKEMIKPAIYAMLSCVVFTAFLNMLNAFQGDFIYTIINTFISGETFSLTGTIGSGLVSGFAYTDFYTLVSNISVAFGPYNMKFYPIIAFVFTTMYSLVMLIAPTSMFLLAGLSYLDIEYKTWVKYIWKALLIIFIIVIIIAFIVSSML